MCASIEHSLLARFCVAAALIGLVAFAGDDIFASTSEQQFVIRTWDRRDGLPPTVISHIQRTSNGYLWIGTQTGLLRFDGSRFKHFEAEENAFLRTNYVRSLLAEPSGALLVGTPLGLFRFPDGRVAAENCEEVGDHFQTYALANGPGGTLWAVTRSNEVIRTIPEQKETRFLISDTQSIRSLHVAEDGQVNVMTRGRVFALDHGRFAKWPGDRLGKIKFDIVVPSRDGGWWATSGREVLRVEENGNATLMEMTDDSPQLQVMAMMEDRLGRLWAGTRNGSVHCLEPGGIWHQVTPRRSRALGSIQCLYEDHDGLIWAGTTAGILHQIKPRLFTTWSLPTTAQESVIQTICVAQDGAVWVGTDGAGAYRFKDGLFSRFGQAEGLANSTVMAILEDSRTNLWFGTLGGLFRYDSGRIKSELDSTLSGQSVPALYEGKTGDLWFGAIGTVIRKRGDEETTYRLGTAVTAYEVRAITEGQNREMWIGTRGAGLFEFKDEQMERIAAFPRPVANTIHCDDEGVLWIGTRAHGLWRVQDGKTLNNWTTADGLPGNMVFAILEDDAGILWLSSNAGVFGLSKRALTDHALGKAGPLLAIQLGSAGGETWSAGSGQPAAAKGPDGRFWFPVGHGVLAFDPVAVMRDRPVLPVLIEEIVADGKGWTLAGSNPVKILSGVRRLEFRYTIADMDAPGRLKFRYKLDGVDDEWVDGGAQRIAYYSHLPPGKYRFNVISSGSANIWTETTPLDLEIIPRLWERGSFQVASTLFVLIFVGATVRFAERSRMRRKLERLELQQSMEKERRRIAQDLHDDLGSGITEIMLLTELAKRDEGPPARLQAQLDGITHKARQVATAMDEIVWTVNPKNDSLPDLASYICDYTREFLGAARIRCRIDVNDHLPPEPVTAQQRHNLFMAVKEALNNAVKHSGATEVWLRISWLANQLAVTVEDNGRGFVSADVRSGGNGLQNMRSRLESIQGRVEFASELEQGTKVVFVLPLVGLGMPQGAGSLN
ncbi:MAG: hypothetical protein H0X66_00060 [Verrucomicrobia bacterium]|nr:hypothetical protein [Verrucomicrobiota bacterium]